MAYDPNTQGERRKAENQLTRQRFDTLRRFHGEVTKAAVKEALKEIEADEESRKKKREPSPKKEPASDSWPI